MELYDKLGVMDIWLRIFFLCILILILVKSADLLEDAFVGIAKKLRINTFTIGFVILALTSSLPETFVAINSAANGVSELSLGNLVGATIVLLTLVTGIYAFKNKSVEFKGFYGAREVMFSMMIILALVISIADGRLHILEGVILIVLYAAFVVYIIKKSQHEEPLHSHRKEQSPYISMIKGVIGGAGLIVSANLTVSNAIVVANHFNTPPILLGLILFSVGTNLPEIVLLFRSNSAEKNSLVVGNFIGSATFNTAILGLLILLRPFTVSNLGEITGALIVLTIAAIVYIFTVKNDNKITRREAVVFLLIFALFLMLELVFNL